MTLTPLAPAVFLDRDGTINEDPGFLADATRVKLFAGVPEALATLRAAGLKLVVGSTETAIKE